jgi:hypothetical protein
MNSTYLLNMNSISVNVVFGALLQARCCCCEDDFNAIEQD